MRWLDRYHLLNGREFAQAPEVVQSPSAVIWEPKIIKSNTVSTVSPSISHEVIGKAPDAGRDWGQEEKGTTEDEMAGWHH